jgi:hypothetical protein
VFGNTNGWIEAVSDTARELRDTGARTLAPMVDRSRNLANRSFACEYRLFYVAFGGAGGMAKFKTF